jgi:WD40 repeat protein
MDMLRRAIWGDAPYRVALTALWGMGGIGKSVLAAALCHDEQVKAVFPDGIVWVPIGREPGNLAAQMAGVGRVLGDAQGRYDTPEASIDSLQKVLQKKAVLLVLDDVWEKHHVESFQVDAPRCHILFTTRDGNIALSVGANEVKLGTLTPAQSLALLREWTGHEDTAMGEIAERLGYLPLALKIAGARLREMNGAEWLHTFQHVSQMKLGRRSTDPKENLQVCFDLSVEQLSEKDRALYYTLGIFPEDTPVPPAVIARLWRGVEPTLSQFDCDELITDLARLALLERNAANKTITLHDLLYDYTREKLDGWGIATHAALLTAYNSDTRPWFQVEHDGYLYHYLAYHLVEGGRKEELRRLLLDFEWLQTKLAATSVNALLADYAYLPDEREVHVVEGAIRLAAHILVQDKTQLAGQLCGRLLAWGTPAIRGLTAQAACWSARPWVRPLTASLTPPGGPLRFTFTGHTAEVRTMACSPDGHWVVSGSDDGTVKVWSLADGQEQATLRGHARGVTAVTCSPDGCWVVSGSDDGTVKVWSLADGQEQATLRGHTRGVTAVACSPDGHWVVSGSSDKTVKVWSLADGQEQATLRGHSSWVTAVACSPDSRWVVSGSDDGTVKVWSLADRQKQTTLRGHTQGVTAVACSPDGCWVVSGSDDGTVKVWSLADGQEQATLHGHTRGVTAVACSPDGHWVVSDRKDVE